MVPSEIASGIVLAALKSTVGAACELRKCDLIRCTEDIAWRLQAQARVHSEAIQRSVNAIAGPFQKSFDTFSLDALPCIWCDLSLVDLSHTEWNRIVAGSGCSNNAQQFLEPAFKIRRSGSTVSDSGSGLGSAESQSRINSGGSSSGSFRREVSNDSTSRCSQAASSLASSSSSQNSSGSQKCSAHSQQIADQAATISMLKSLVAAGEAQLAETKLKLRSSQQHNRRTEARLQECQEELRVERAKRLHDFVVTKTSDMYKKRRVDQKRKDKGNAWEWLTPQGSLALGIRKNFSNIASSDIGITLCDDISRWTVTRMEVRVSACMVANSYQFFRCWKEHACNEEQNEWQPVTIISFRQDGTNSGIFNKSKLIALELEASYKLDIPSSDSSDGQRSICDYECHDTLQNWRRIKRLADVQVVKQGSGPATLALTQKMLESLGCPHWGTLRNSGALDGEDERLQLGVCFLQNH